MNRSQPVRMWSNQGALKGKEAELQPGLSCDKNRKLYCKLVDSGSCSVDAAMWPLFIRTGPHFLISSQSKDRHSRIVSAPDWLFGHSLVKHCADHDSPRSGGPSQVLLPLSVGSFPRWMWRVGSEVMP